MIALIQLDGQQLRVDFTRGTPIAIPLDPHGPQPAFFTDSRASATPLQAGDFVGDVRLGGTCNAEIVSFIPQCHGTHTECRGHLTHERLQVHDTIHATPCLARLVSIKPEACGEDGYPRFPKAPLAAALAPHFEAGLKVEAIVVRTLPNDPARMSTAWEHAPPYPVFSEAAMTALAAMPLKHLLVDAPSLDPAHDAGALRIHRLWWCMADNPKPTGMDPARRSVTEMIYVPDALADGLYWLEPGLSPLVAESTPSRPVLYPAEVNE